MTIRPRLAMPALLAGVLALGACTGGSNGAPVISFQSLTPIACVANADTTLGFDCAATLMVKARGGGTGTLVQGQLSSVSIGGLVDSSAETWSGPGAYALPLAWSAASCAPGAVDVGVYAAILVPTQQGSYAIGAAVQSSGDGDTRSCH